MSEEHKPEEKQPEQPPTDLPEPAEPEKPKSWKQLSILVFDLLTVESGWAERIIETAALQYEVDKFVSFTHAWISKPESIDWSQPVPTETLLRYQLNRELVETALPFSVHCSTLGRLMNTAPIWCAHQIVPKLWTLNREFAFYNKMLPSSAGKLVLDTAVIDIALNPGKESYDLSDVAQRWNVPYGVCRSANHDAICCSRVLRAMMDKLPDDANELVAKLSEWLAAPAKQEAIDERQG